MITGCRKWRKAQPSSRKRAMCDWLSYKRQCLDWRHKCRRGSDRKKGEGVGLWGSLFLACVPADACQTKNGGEAERIHAARHHGYHLRGWHCELDCS